MKTYTLESTKDPHLFRVVDSDGNWQHYAYLKEAPKMAPSWDDLGDVVFMRGATTVLDRGYAKGKYLEEWLVRSTPEERDRVLKGAGERGDKVHRYINIMLEGAGRDLGNTFSRTLNVYSRNKKEEVELTLDEWGCVLAFAAFWRRHKPILYATEMPAYSFELECAGTGDAIFELTAECEDKKCVCHGLIGKLGLPDWKTSSGIRAPHSAQTGFYASCENIRAFLPKGREIDYTAVLRIGTTHKNGGYEFKVFDPVEGLQRFKAALTIDDFEYRPFDPAIEVEDIPEELTIEVDRWEPPKEKPKKKRVTRKPKK